MGFPVPGDAIEQSLDLNQHLIHNPAATFFMRVEGDMATEEVQPGDLLVVDRAQTAQSGALVVAAIAGAFHVLRVRLHQGHLIPATGWSPGQTVEIEIWGIVTHLIRKT